MEAFKASYNFFQNTNQSFDLQNWPNLIERAQEIQGYCEFDLVK